MYLCNCYKYIKKTNKDYLLTSLKIRQLTKYTLEEILEKSLKYDYLIDFRLDNPQMYNWISSSDGRHFADSLEDLSKE